MFVNYLNVTNILNHIFIRPHFISADSVTNNILNQMSGIQGSCDKMVKVGQVAYDNFLFMGYRATFDLQHCDYTRNLVIRVSVLFFVVCQLQTE